MAEWDKIVGVEDDDVVKVKGVTKANAEKILGQDTPTSVASAWYIGSSGGKIFRTTTANASSGWSEIVDVGSVTAVSTAIGEDNSGNQRIMFNNK